MLGLCFCVRAFSSCGKRGPLFIAVRRPLTVAPLLLRSTGSRRTGSVVVAHGPSCSAACGIFPDQGSNPCPLHWQADSQPLRHQGSPGSDFLLWLFSVLPHDHHSPAIKSLCSDVNRKQNKNTFNENVYFAKSVPSAENPVINKPGVRCKNGSSSLWRKDRFLSTYFQYNMNFRTSDWKISLK